MAGSGSPKTNQSEISQCGGTDFAGLPSYDGVLQGYQGTCVTIIDEETVFVAGGMQSKSLWDQGPTISQKNRCQPASNCRN